MRHCSITLAPRLLLAVIPALVGFSAWDLFNGWFLFGSDLYPYLWYRPLMDILFGLLVLGPFVDADHRVLRIVGLVGASLLAHFVAVEATYQTQWLSGMLAGGQDFEAIGPRFVSVLPIAVLVTALLMWIARPIAGLEANRTFWRNALLAGVLTGCTFFVAMETQSPLIDWLGQRGFPWMLWHATVCAAIYLGTTRPPKADTSAHPAVHAP